MTDVLLPSLEIQNFRALRHLKIERLARVNLIVGKNNVGKTSLLEALWLYAQRGSWSAIWDLLEQRDEGSRPKDTLTTTPELIEAQSRSYAQLYTGRRDLEHWNGAIQIGSPHDQENKLAIDMNSNASAGNKPDAASITGLILRRGQQQIIYPFVPREARYRSRTDIIPAYLISANGLGKPAIAELWDAITLTDREDDVIRALQLIEPDVMRVNVRSERDRNVIVRLRAIDQQVRLRSLGEGMYRMFGIALALVNTKDGLLLIDEIENGLHYSVLPEMWRLIFAVASRLNVQVFATTHSWDCVEAFQIAASADPAEGQIIRLGQTENGISATVFDEKELVLIARDQIEVR